MARCTSLSEFYAVRESWFWSPSSSLWPWSWSSLRKDRGCEAQRSHMQGVGTMNLGGNTVDCLHVPGLGARRRDTCQC